MIKYPKAILTLIAHFKKFPGVGNKTAERFVFQLIKWQRSEIESFANSLKGLFDNISNCPQCGCFIEKSCPFCDSQKRNEESICIIASSKDAYSIEETNSYIGLYHVIENLISPLDGFNIDEKNISRLENRIREKKVKEVIIALDSTLEGDATSLFLKNRLKKLNVEISRIAFGIPIGSSLEYIDGGTLTKAFLGRQKI